MKKSQQLTEEQALITLDKIYDLVLNGIPKVSKPIEEFARDNQISIQVSMLLRY